MNGHASLRAKQKVRELLYHLEKRDPAAAEVWGQCIQVVVGEFSELTSDIPIRLVAGRESSGVLHHGGGVLVVEVGLAQTPEAVVFGLYHELGHILDEEPRSCDPTVEEQLRREERAWDLTVALIAPVLREAFGLERERCLLTHRKAARENPGRLCSELSAYQRQA